MDSPFSTSARSRVMGRDPRPAGAEPEPPRPLRCAIYARKSTEDGLTQEFNTLEAQRESAEAYVRSQGHAGWTTLPERYDDGGYSGANLDRPALRQLLADIEVRRIDCVLVYRDRSAEPIAVGLRAVDGDLRAAAGQSGIHHPAAEYDGFARPADAEYSVILRGVRKDYDPGSNAGQDGSRPAQGEMGGGHAGAGLRSRGYRGQTGGEPGRSGPRANHLCALSAAWLSGIRTRGDPGAELDHEAVADPRRQRARRAALLEGDIAAAADQCPVSGEGVPSGGSLRGRAGAAGRGTALETGPREAGPGTAPGRHGRRRPGERDGCPPALLRAGRASGSSATDHAPAGFGSEVRGSDSFWNGG